MKTETRFPVHKGILRKDGTVNVYGFMAGVQIAVEEFAKEHKGAHYDSATWNKMFEDYLEKRGEKA